MAEKICTFKDLFHKEEWIATVNVMFPNDKGDTVPVVKEDIVILDDEPDFLFVGNTVTDDMVQVACETLGIPFEDVVYG